MIDDLRKVLLDETKSWGRSKVSPQWTRLCFLVAYRRSHYVSISLHSYYTGSSLLSGSMGN
jgi:hypothetical protein